MNDDVRSPGSGGTPGPLSQPPASQQSLDTSDPGECHHTYVIIYLYYFKHTTVSYSRTSTHFCTVIIVVG